MLQKILVAIDKSDISIQALDMAIALAQANQAQLKLIHVLDECDPDEPTFPHISELHDYADLSTALLNQYHDDYQLFINRSWEWLNWQTNQAIAAGVAASCDQPSGPAGSSICHSAQQWDADLIVIGSRCLMGLKEFLLGSVSNHVMHHAPCSVYVVHPKQAQTKAAERNAHEVATR
ncbi:MAG: universal stress protein [Cyanothece sp. SIO2G6]|nr:universal stress protein [Cyanothece sp. SIO2G6]